MTHWIDVAAASRDLVRGLLAQPWGQVSPSVYETGRVVVFAPWLVGQTERVEFLRRGQRSDGRWGGPDGYGLVPTLSATDALLAVAAASADDVVSAARRGLAALRRWLPTLTRSELPDMPAIELIVPSLVESINARLSAADDRGGRLLIPAGLSADWLSALRALIAGGGPVDVKVAHALEVAGPAAVGSRSVTPSSTGSIGASAAATAAWLGVAPPAADHPARRFLEVATSTNGGPVPCALPITAFERGWVVGTLARAGIIADLPGEIVAGLRRGADGAGTATGPGLPPDADTTSANLYALASIGAPVDLDALWQFATPTHFCTWRDEQGVSTTVNAHVLEAIAATVGVPAPGSRPDAAIGMLSAWLPDQQHPDGYWTDRWHGSPYYATASCAVALHRYGRHTSPAVPRALDWLLATQRLDGSWGRWSGTAEETAYAVQALVLTSSEHGPAVRRGHAYLVEALESDSTLDSIPALWHDKDLYAPTAVVRAVVLAAIALAQESMRSTQPERSMMDVELTGDLTSTLTGTDRLCVARPRSA